MYTSRKLTRISRSIRALITLAIVVLALAPTIGAAAYPDKVINLIVAFPAGGGTDLVARALVPYLQKNLGGATIVVLNRPGAGGGIGFAAWRARLPTATRSVSSTRRTC